MRHSIGTPLRRRQARAYRLAQELFRPGVTSANQSRFVSFGVENIMKASRTLIAAAMIAGLGVACTAAIAQQQPAAPIQDGKGQDGAGSHHDHHGMLPSQRAEARLAYIKTALQITPAQTAQWNAFADVVRKHAKARDAEVEDMRAKFAQHKKDDARPDLVERLEFRQKMLNTAAADTGELLTALKPLYASFSDSQKQTAAEVLSHGHEGHGGWHHMGGR